MDQPWRIDADGGTVTSGPGAGLTASRRLRHGEVWVATTPLPTALAPPDPTLDALAGLIRTLADEAAAEGAGAVHWETDDGAAPVDAVAATAGLDERRDVLQLRRPLPLPSDALAATRPVAVRPLRPGTADEEAWVRCNNRSFAAHPDQGHESVASLRTAVAEPWFDAGGFLLAEGEPGVDDGGDLDGFCWTKVHPPTPDDLEMGEIYVIGIDPAASGRGLGRSLTVAGLEHLAGRGVGTAMLYVDADNGPARRLYDGLGFALHRTRRVRSRTLRPAPDHSTE